MTHQECTEKFADLLYRELDPAAAEECRSHMRGCPPCAKAYAGLEATLAIMDRRERDEPAAGFWASYAERVERRLDPAPPRVAADAPRVLPLRLGWIYAAAAILLVGAGIYIGTTFFPGRPAAGAPPAVAAASPVDSPADSLADRTSDYLERSKVLLQGIVNQDDASGTASHLRRQRRASRELISEAQALTAALREPEQQQVRELISDLQIILLQLANIEVEPGRPAIELVKQGVSRKSILLKIHVEELRTLARRQASDALNDTSNTQL